MLTVTTFDLPVNDAELIMDIIYVFYEGRNGVVKFDGAGNEWWRWFTAFSDGVDTRSFIGTYLYITEWVDGAYLFNKVNNNSTIISFQLGANLKEI